MGFNDERPILRRWAALAAFILVTATASALATQPAGAATPTASVSPHLANGLALTPQMGFNNWNATHCGSGFNETMVKSIADLFVSGGLKDAGYQYVNIDDCWALPQRDASGNLVPDPARFPDGIKAVADYVHAKGLKFGLYSSAGTKTCNSAGFPGGLGHEQQDATLFASWGVDYLKYDNCNNQNVPAQQRYPAMRDALAATGRPILFAICEWGQSQPWTWAGDVGNSWRTTGDINDTYARMLSNFKQNVGLAQFAGPGHWNDPDMLEVGNGGMTGTEYRSHFSLWSIMAAPLLIGTDLRKASAETMNILKNTDVIAVDQDPLGVQGTEISSSGGRHVIVKPLVNGDRAVTLFNENDSDARISTTAATIGMPAAAGYQLRDLWAHTDRETAGTIAATVPAHGTAMYRVSANRNWPFEPPAVDNAAGLLTAYPGAPSVLTPGQATTVTTTATNSGRLPAIAVSQRLTVPATWSARPTTRPFTPVLGTNRSLNTVWAVNVPAGTVPGSYPLTATASYYPGQGLTPTTVSYSVTAIVPPPPPSGTAALSHVPWLSATNGYGPVEIDTSNGESKAGDGHPITIAGTVYPLGLGTNAPSTIVYYLGGRCSAMDTYVGVDDEKKPKGTVTFQLWSDGTEIADSGLMTDGQPATHLTGDLSGATLLRLVVTDGGDGNDSDHADWAMPHLTCS